MLLLPFSILVKEDSKEEIARPNADKPVVSASKMCLGIFITNHTLRHTVAFRYNTIVIRSIYSPVYL